VGDAIVGDVELDLGEGDVAAYERIDGLVDRFLDREAERGAEAAGLGVEGGLFAGGEDPARDVLARGGRAFEIDADAGGAGGCDERGRARAFMADGADPALGEDGGAAIVGEDGVGGERRRELGEGGVERGAARDQLAAANGREGCGERLLRSGERGERGVEGGVGELDDRAEAVGRLEALVWIRAWQGARSLAG